MEKNLVLTGMMGVGKSTIGKLLSKKMNMKFEDTDSLIEKKLSLSIKEIFKTEGEKFFRKIEEKETILLLKKENLILALGGGAFLNNKIRENIKKFSVSVWLDLSPKYIFQRTNKSDKRPLLNNIKSENDLNKLYEKRKDIYSKADYRIDCNFKTPNEIAIEIKNIYENI